MITRLRQRSRDAAFVAVTILLLALRPVLWLLERAVPAEPTLILLGSAWGRAWADSPRALHEYLLARGPHTHWRPVWITVSRSVMTDVAAAGGEVVHAASPRALWLILRATQAIYSHSVLDVTAFPSLLPRRLRLVYTTHDVSPKRSRYMVAGRRPGLRDRLLHLIANRVTTVALSTSPFMTEVLSLQTRLPREVFVELGLPKADRLCQIVPEVPEPERDLRILYAPTWRSNRRPVELFPLKSVNQEFGAWLEAERIVLDVRPHKNDMRYATVRSRLETLERISPRVNAATWERQQSITELLPRYDVLISDYSGVIHEFLLLDRPIVLLPYDLEQFTQEQGFIYDYEKWAPGPIVRDWLELREAIAAARQSWPEHAERRAALRQLIWGSQQTDSCGALLSMLARA